MLIQGGPRTCPQSLKVALIKVGSIRFPLPPEVRVFTQADESWPVECHDAQLLISVILAQCCV